MTWLWVAVGAQIILGTSAVLDKFLLRRGFFDAWVYTFWSSVLGMTAIILLPFGFVSLPAWTIFLALLQGMVFVAATLFFFLSLQKGEASVALPIIGGLAPVATLFFSNLLLASSLGAGEFLGFFMLVAGGIFLLLAEKREFRARVVALAFSSAFFFGISNVLAKMVFDAGPFISGFVWMRVGNFLPAAVFFLLPSFRERVKTSLKESIPINRFFYLSNRFYASLGGILGTFAIFLGHPALVDATGGLKYAVIFLGAWLILREKFSGKTLFIKTISSILIIVGLVWLALTSYAASIPYDKDREIRWGVTFSDKFSRELGLDWKENFDAMLRDLKPRKLRLVAYWDDIEKERGIFDFSNLDWQIRRGGEAGTRLTVVLGMKVPRWPECFLPSWASLLLTEEREEALRAHMKEVLVRYRDESMIERWQVENEPFLMFGECSARGKQFLEKEIALVKSLDPSRPVLVTDGGEFGLWKKAASHGDIFGTTMYRIVYPRFIGPVFGVIEYPLSPDFFRIKERLVRWLLNDDKKRFVVIELQGEPWERRSLASFPPDELLAHFSPAYLRETIEYAKQTGFDEYYFWGAEWWYWMKTKHNNPAYWNIAKEIL